MKTIIKINGSESRSQQEEACVHTHIQACVTTTVSYLHGWQVEIFEML